MRIDPHLDLVYACKHDKVYELKGINVCELTHI